jgi:hypothetical protein
VLYTREQGRHAVDTLCEQALAIALSYADEGMDIAVGYSAVRGNLTAKAKFDFLNSLPPAVSLSFPAAIPLSSPAEFPALPDSEKRGALVLALPRTTAGVGNALDSFLQTRAQNQMTELVFICGTASRMNNRKKRNAALTEAGISCAAIYGKRGGVSARYEM